MHVYTWVWLKSDRTGFLIVGLKHLDYSIDSRITHACIHSIRLDSDFAFCAGSRFFSQGREPEVEGWQRQCLSSEITASKSAIVHLVCVIIMYTIYEMYKDKALSCSNAKAEFVVVGDVKRSARSGSITTITTYRTRIWHASANCSCLNSIVELWL